MKKINSINIILLLILIFFNILNNNYLNKNLEKLEKSFFENYNNINYQNLVNENYNLTKLLNLENYKLNNIFVKGYFFNIYEEFIISKGKNEGVINDLAVINEDRLIGFVRNAHDNYANVELLENLNKKISIKVNENYGFLEVCNNELIITGIEKENMNINDKVYTSGLTHIPGNIYIGKIYNIQEKDDTFETKAYLSIEKNYHNYKYLLVVKE